MRQGCPSFACQSLFAVLVVVPPCVSDLRAPFDVVELYLATRQTQTIRLFVTSGSARVVRLCELLLASSRRVSTVARDAECEKLIGTEWEANGSVGLDWQFVQHGLT